MLPILGVLAYDTVELSLKHLLISSIQWDPGVPRALVNTSYLLVTPKLLLPWTPDFYI